jgi:hypothetical protein
MAVTLSVWKKSEEATESVVVGTVNSIAGKKGYYELTSDRNFTSKSLVSIKVVDKKGASALLICSPDISKDLRATKSQEELLDALDELGNCQVVEKIMQSRNKKGELQFDEDDEPIMEEVHFINRGSSTDMSSTRREVNDDTVKPSKAKGFNWDDRIAGL